MSGDPHPTYLMLSAFLEQHPVCKRAALPIKPGAHVCVQFFDHDESYTFFTDSIGPHLRPGAPEDPDFTIRLTIGMVNALCTLESNDIGEFGALLLGLGLSPNPEVRLGGAIHASFSRLWRNGYFGVMRLGGWRVAKVLAARGLASIGVLRKKIDENTKPVDGA